MKPRIKKRGRLWMCRYDLPFGVGGPAGHGRTPMGAYRMWRANQRKYDAHMRTLLFRHASPL